MNEIEQMKREQLGDDIRCTAQELAGEYAAREDGNPPLAPRTCCAPIPLLLDEAWPMKDMINKLLEAADILLDDYGYTGDRWEEIAGCRERVREVMKGHND